jgi:hypothetical protein
MLKSSPAFPPPKRFHNDDAFRSRAWLLGNKAAHEKRNVITDN